MSQAALSSPSVSDPVEVATFVAEMSRRWTEDLGNVASEPLRQQWVQIATVFNQMINAYETKAGEEWQILTAATGTAKTKGLAVYCSLLAQRELFDHPGVLCVTKMRDEADDLAKTINDWSGGKSCAIAYHGEAQEVKVTDLALYPVLVITHSAYQRALDTINRDSPTLKSWAAFMRWIAGSNRRKLVVIDEAIELAEEATVDVDTVTRVLGYIPLSITQRFPLEVAAMRKLRDHLEQLAIEKAEAGCSESMLSNGDDRLFGDVDLTEFRRAMMSEGKYDHANFTHDFEERRRIAMIADGIFRKVQLTLERWVMYAKLPQKGVMKHTLNTSKLLIPDGTQGCVVLDATARINPVYKLFSKARVWPRIPGTRNYSNVRLYVSRGHSVGRQSLLRDPDKAASEFIEALKGRLDGRKVFLVCHKDVVPSVEKFKPNDDWKIGHWGAITGKNDWRACNAFAGLGLPYKPDVSTALEFMAFQGVQSDEWLANRGNRPFGGHDDIRQALRIGGIAADTVQAMNRTGFRKVIDDQGNCRGGPAFLPLPNGTLGDELLKLICEEMPGIQIMDEWSYSGAKRKARSVRHREAFLKWLPSMPHGKMTASQVRQKLRIPETPWKKIIAALSDQSSDTAKKLAAAGVKYERGGGRGCPSRFIKK